MIIIKLLFEKKASIDHFLSQKRKNNTKNIQGIYFFCRFDPKKCMLLHF